MVLKLVLRQGFWYSSWCWGRGAGTKGGDAGTRWVSALKDGAAIAEGEEGEMGDSKTSGTLLPECYAMSGTDIDIMLREC